MDGMEPLFESGCAHLQDLVSRFHIKKLGHEGDDVGLGNGLSLTYGQRGVVVGSVSVPVRHEVVPGHGA